MTLSTPEEAGLWPIRELPVSRFPTLEQIPDPPHTLYARGEIALEGRHTLTVVGSRKHTAYGKDVVHMLINGLRNTPITIISGLALGIDGLAHQAAIDAGLPTIAVPGSGLSWECVYPKYHIPLAKHILASGGGLLSEFSPDTSAAPWTFPKRNRIMAGLSDAVLIIEAQEQSGTLITARLAMEYNRDVLIVPGGITSPSSRGPNGLLRDGAIPILSSTDILDVFGITQEEAHKISETQGTLSEIEQKFLHLVREPTERDALLTTLGLSPEQGNVVILELEIKGLIRTYGGLVMRS
jgi:DNA processing protein